MTRPLVIALLCLAALTMFSPSNAATAAAAHLAVAPPAEFGDLTGAHVILVDIYFGGTKIGEELAVEKPGSLKFRNPREVLAKIPQAIISPELEDALSADLPTNSDQACAPSNANKCGLLKPDRVGIIYDEDRFRVDIFVNSKFLRTPSLNDDGYLPAPPAAVSMTDTIGANVSGTIAGKANYEIQNRTIVAFDEARIRADTAVASGLGLLVDDFAAEVDRNGLRYSGGLFWAPASEFIGQRRILGAGVGTQFDTFADREALSSTPLIVFLADACRIDVVVDGRLVSSRAYAAGNVEVETAGLADGSYPVVLRIHHANGSIEEQRRFFVKSSQVPAAGHPIVYAFGGLLANTRANAPISASRTFFYELGAARRLSNAIAVDVAALGTQHKQMAEAGGWLVTKVARVRAAGLISSSGDWGALLQLATAAHGPFSMTVDVRRIWSRHDAPLVPLPATVGTFDIAPAAGVQLALGSYTQATASVGLRVANGFLSFIGSYRKDRSFPADYTLGPSLSVPLMERNAMQVVFDASAQRSRSASAAFAGLRVLFSSKRLSLGASLGGASQTDGESKQTVTRAIGSVSAEWSEQSPAGSEIRVAGDVERNIGSSTAHAEALVDGPFGNFRADLLKDLEGSRMPQYNVAFQSGLAVGTEAMALGSRELEQSAILISVGGDAPDASFAVLIDGASRGVVKPGHRLALFVPSYRTYAVRLVPTSSQNISFDTAERQVTLYPGNIRNLAWTIDRFVTLFGQAISEDGVPIANALVETGKEVAQTDASGYFQIDSRSELPIRISTGGGGTCHLQLPKIVANNDFSSVGKVICR